MGEGGEEDDYPDKDGPSSSESEREEVSQKPSTLSSFSADSSARSSSPIDPGDTAEVQVGICMNMIGSKEQKEIIDLMKESKRGVPPPGFLLPLPGATPFPEGTMVAKFKRSVISNKGDTHMA